jgi:hypothetical protein
MNLLDNGQFATVSQILDVSFSGTPPNNATYNTVAGGRLQQLTGDASEMLMSAASVAARYLPTDLLPNYAITPFYPGGGNLMISIVCGLTFGPVLKRRGRATKDWENLSAAYAEAMGYIEQLRKGDRIFSLVPNVPQAGLPAQQNMLPVPGINPPLLTQLATRYFGRQPPTQGFPPSNQPN